ncbi:MAG: type I 3-dehydroquinate dehydratase [Algisphaera sp.]
MTLIAVPIFVESLETAHAAAARAAEHGADLVEYRIDTFTQPAEVQSLVARSPLPCLITARAAWEGGHCDLDETDRVSLLEHAGLGADGHTPAYLDLELKAYQTSANLRQKIGLVVDHPSQTRSDVTAGLILSTHDFETFPPDLDRRILAMADAPACRIIKAAWRARSLRDNIDAFELINRKLKPTIALCMGEAGLPSRVLAKKFGAHLTFASLNTESTTAPGQPTLDELKNLYRWDALDSQTKVYGVIGHPVAHSASPAFHNAGFTATGFNGVYLPMPIAPEYEHFKATVIRWLDYAPLHFSGASVTLPHKQNLLKFIKEQGGDIEPLANTIGAANTLARKSDGSLYAGNTDYAAILDATCAAMEPPKGHAQLQGKIIAVLGAGGAARAAVAGFAAQGAHVTVYNRTLEKAQALAAEFDASAKPLDQLDPYAADLVINCTSVGMHPHINATPTTFPQTQSTHRPIVFDTVYNPVETQLLRQAQAAGCNTLNGLEMFVRQGAAQYALWTGHQPPLDVFRAVLEARKQ